MVCKKADMDDLLRAKSEAVSFARAVRALNIINWSSVGLETGFVKLGPFRTKGVTVRAGPPWCYSY
jgi:hypothetical protein